MRKCLLVFYDFFLFVFQVLEEKLSSVQRNSVTTPTPRTAQNTTYAFLGARSWNLAQEGLCTGQLSWNLFENFEAVSFFFMLKQQLIIVCSLYSVWIYLTLTQFAN